MATIKIIGTSFLWWSAVCTTKEGRGKEHLIFNSIPIVSEKLNKSKFLFKILWTESYKKENKTSHSYRTWIEVGWDANFAK